jgi:hypothetical protein
MRSSNSHSKTIAQLCQSPGPTARIIAVHWHKCPHSTPKNRCATFCRIYDKRLHRANCVNFGDALDRVRAAAYFVPMEPDESGKTNTPVASEGATAKCCCWPRRRKYWALGLGIAVLTMLVLAQTDIIDLRPPPLIPATCTGRLAMIDDAITEWAFSTRKSTTEAPLEKDILRYIRLDEVPHCPGKGMYQLGTLALATSCSVHGHANVPWRQSLKPPSKFQQTLRKYIPHFRARTGRGISCLWWLKEMDGAIQQWVLESHKKPEDAVIVSEIAEYLKGSQFHLCPQFGKYYFNRVKDGPFCTVIGHSL